jgi:hypothetical protein
MYDAKADLTNAYLGDIPTLLKKAAELAGNQGAPEEAPGQGRTPVPVKKSASL